MIDRLFNIYQKPLKHIYLTEEGEPGRNFYGMPHDFLNGAVVVSTDGHNYTVTNSMGGVDQYRVDESVKKAMHWIPLLLLDD